MQGKEGIQLDSQTLTLGDQYIVGDTYQDKGLQRPTRCELHKLRACLTHTDASSASCIHLAHVRSWNEVPKQQRRMKKHDWEMLSLSLLGGHVSAGSL